MEHESLIPVLFAGDDAPVREPHRRLDGGMAVAFGAARPRDAPHALHRPAPGAPLATAVLCKLSGSR